MSTAKPKLLMVNRVGQAFVAVMAALPVQGNGGLADLYEVVST
jgi:hypothetical protein